MKEKATTFSSDNPKCLKASTMIILNNKNVKSNISEIIRKYKKDLLNLPFLECPYCASSELIKHGTYSRNICYIDEGCIKIDTVNIQRVKCKKCGHTHALLPSFIIPYKVHLLDVILSGISDGEEALDIPFDTINKWNKEFNKFLPYLKTMLETHDKKEIINKIKDNIRDTYQQFYNHYKKILMMMKPGIYNMAPF